jgi:hypothetical protein
VSGEAKAALDRLAEVEASLARAERLTLDPARERARSLQQIGEALLSQTLPLGLAAALADGLAATATAIGAHFPENLLWDLEHLTASVLKESLRSRDPSAHVRASFTEIVELHALFGHGTAIRFRYAHDFVYGFDWAKWVRREPITRRSVGPFDLVFLRAMRVRGGELLALIDEGDATYPPLPDERARNPFTFSREPADELALYRDLAARGLLPVRAWTFGDPPIWDRAFAEERAARAVALGLRR